MNLYRALLISTLLFQVALNAVAAEEEIPFDLTITPLRGEGSVEGQLTDQIAVLTSPHVIRFSHPTYGQGVLVADRSRFNGTTGDVEATGNVRLQRDDLVWVGDKLKYNFKTRKLEAVQFRAGGALPGHAPVFVSGENVGGDYSNNVYSAQNAYITTDDVAEPATRIRASSITIVPGRYLEARNAVVYAGKMPVFYFPYFRQRLDGAVRRFDVVPGYRSRYGGFLLGSYNWTLNDQLDGVVHGDYRTRRGGAGGLDFNLHLDRWGESTLTYYHLYDLDPETDNLGYNIPNDRNRLAFTYDASLLTNLTVKSQIRYQGDERILANFFESEYRANPQPSTFLELNGHTDNFALDLYTQYRLNEFFDNVERLPELRLTGFRQQLFDTPLYYDSESSVGYYRRRFAETNGVITGINYEAPRADTYHQLTLPQTYFGWLQLVPRVGGRVTYYGETSGAGTTWPEEETRTVFNTGAELTFKASRTWSDSKNGWLALDGLRHIVQPSANYVFVPKPSHRPAELPQFDFELPSLRLLPIEFPEYNAIDSVDAQNTIRLGLRNRFQTKRNGIVQDFLFWDVYSDWRLDPRDGQERFSDLFSDVVFRPRDWITLESLTRFDLDLGEFRLAFHNLTLAPDDRWSWSVSHLYVRDDFGLSPTALQSGNSSVLSTIFLRVDENWGLRAQHQYELSEDWLQTQTYSVYRDLRNWTAALSFRIRDPRNNEDVDYTVALTVSLKALPKYGVGEDAVRPTRLLGY